jgi:hypothetical protein
MKLLGLCLYFYLLYNQDEYQRMHRLEAVKQHVDIALRRLINRTFNSFTQQSYDNST